MHNLFASIFGILDFCDSKLDYVTLKHQPARTRRHLQRSILNYVRSRLILRRDISNNASTRNQNLSSMIRNKGKQLCHRIVAFASWPK